MNRIYLISIVLGSMLSGCASVTGSPNQSISIQTREQSGKEVEGAKCDIINKRGTWFITTPGTATIHRSNDDIQVTCRKEGLEAGRASVVSDTKGSMFGNILLGGGIGAIVDHNNGSAYEYPTLIQIVMGAFTKVGTPAKEVTKTSSPITVESNIQATKSDSQDLTAKLKELKNLYEQGLISEEVYKERQNILLAQ